MPTTAGDYLLRNETGHHVRDRFRIILPKSNFKAYEVGDDRDLVLQHYYHTIHLAGISPEPSKEQKADAQTFLDYAAFRFLFEKGVSLPHTKNLDNHEFAAIVVPNLGKELRITEGGAFEMVQVSYSYGTHYDDCNLEYVVYDLIDSEKRKAGVFYLYKRNYHSASLKEPRLTVRTILRNLGPNVKVEKLESKD